MTLPKFPCATYAAQLPPEQRDQFARYAHWAEWEDLDAFLGCQAGRKTEGQAVPTRFYRRP